MAADPMGWAIGLMTGTVLDGNIDIAMIRTDGERVAELGPFAFAPYPPEIRALQIVVAQVRRVRDVRESDGAAGQFHQGQRPTHHIFTLLVFGQEVFRPGEPPIFRVKEPAARAQDSAVVQLRPGHAVPVLLLVKG